jgi:hypothetical protein
MDGRVVRCAKCRHSWFQDGPELALELADRLDAPAPDQPEPLPSPDSAETPAFVPASDIVPLPPIADLPQTRDFAETPSSFAHEPPFRPRRNPATFWIWTAILFALVAIAAIAAVAEFGVPDWLPLPLPRSAFVEAHPDLALDFAQSQQNWRPLPNGNSFFNVSGSITNVGRERRTVPTLVIVLRDAHQANVYSLETAAPKSVLAPGESETIDQAIIDAPKSARAAQIGWKPR